MTRRTTRMFVTLLDRDVKALSREAPRKEENGGNIWGAKGERCGKISLQHMNLLRKRV